MTPGNPVDNGDSGKSLVVIGPGAIDLIDGGSERESSCQLLELRLVVLATWLFGRLDDSGMGVAEDDLPGPLPAAIDVDGAEQRFQGIGEDRLLRPPPDWSSPLPRRSSAPTSSCPTEVGQGRGVDDRSSKLCQLALGKI